MATHKRWDTVYLDNNTIAEEVQYAMDCRDGIVTCATFNDCEGYGSLHKAFFCTDSKAESSSLVIYWLYDNEWKITNNMSFMSGDWGIIRDLINRKENRHIETIRSYMDEM